MIATDERDTTPSPEPRASHIPRLIAGGVLLLIGLLWLLERAGAVEMNATTVLAIATVVVGVALMILSREAHGGLITLGIILAVLAGLTALAPVEGFRGGIGERTVDIESAADLASGYEVAMGTMLIDLRGVEDPEDLGVLNASVGMGELIIRVPDGLDVELRAQVAAGEVAFFGEHIGGVGVEETRQTPGFEEATERLVIEAEVFMGRLEVTDG